jgi:hypothetical protein
MPNWMRITDGTGMHAGFFARQPRLARLHPQAARLGRAFFESVAVGTSVRIEA